MAWLVKESECVNWGEVDEHEDEHEDDLFDNEGLDSYVLRQEPSGGAVRNYVTRSEGENVIGDDIKTTVEVARTRNSTESWKKDWGCFHSSRWLTEKWNEYTEQK